MRIAIIGAGAMGSLYGGYLSEISDQVFLIDIWQDHVDQMNKNGLIIEENGREIPVHPRALTDSRELDPVDLIIIFVKSTYTASALEGNLNLIGEETRVLSLQNGYGNIEEINKFVEEKNIIAGTTAHGSTLLGPGRIRHAGSGETHIGLVSGGSDNRVKEIASLLEQAGFATVVSENVVRLIWDKLLINVGINALTAILNITNGRLPEYQEGKELMELAVSEAAMVAARKGVQFEVEEMVARVIEVARATGENRSSMLQDISNHRRTEIDKINGAIIREGEKCGIPTPVNLILTDLVKMLEYKYQI